MACEEWAHAVGRSCEVAAVVVLVVGFLAALVGAGIVWRTSGSARVAYRTLRELLGGGLLIALIFSIAFMTETIEHRATKAGYPPGTAARLRAERAERDRVERRSPYRQGGSGSFD